jgi:hypothetical protein
MAGKKKVAEKVAEKQEVVKEVKVEEVKVEAVVDNHVTQHLDVDPNDPRSLPVVDGNELPKVDINVAL